MTGPDVVNLLELADLARRWMRANTDPMRASYGDESKAEFWRDASGMYIAQVRTRDAFICEGAPTAPQALTALALRIESDLAGKPSSGPKPTVVRS